MKKLDLVGQKFSKLTVIEKAEPIGERKRSAWLCKCDCGTQKIIKTDELRSGDTKSCGCWNNEQRAARAKQMYAVNIKYDPRITTARRVWKSRYPEMSFDDFYELSQQNCYYCDSPPNNIQNAAKSDEKSSSFAKENGDFIYNGVDRIDNALDHSDINNCVSCCKFCNYSKRDRTTEEFKSWIANLYAHFCEKEKEDINA